MKLVQFVVNRYRIARTLSVIQQLSDRSIADIGFSPELVRQGRSGYPWKTGE